MSSTDASTHANPSIGELAARIRSSDPHSGLTRVVLIDGPAGAGKSTLANRLAVALGGAASAGAGTYDPAAQTSADAGDVPDSPVQIIHGDDMYEGWGGLATLDELLVGEVLDPLSRGRAAGFAMWDWIAGARTHYITVPARPFLILEGVGVAQRAARPYASLIIWVDAPWETRLQRGLDRDGEAMRDEWEQWEAAQNAHHASDGTRASAHVVIDGTRPVPLAGARDVRRLSDAPELLLAGRELLDAYFRLPDAWPGGASPVELPAAHQGAVDAYPGAATPPHGDALIAVVGDRAIGQVLVSRADANTAYLERMFVIPEASAQGVAQALIEAAIALARSLGCARVELDVIPTRDTAIELYRNAGFVEDAEPRPDGLVGMSLDLARR